jgi:ABC-type dipeptide/oligopeptide/nickel transport system permease subunit
VRPRFPSEKYPFGTSVIGINILSDLLHGAEYALYVAVFVTAITMVIAILMEAFAGYFGGHVDNVLMRLAEVFLVFPGFLFILLFVKVFTLSNKATAITVPLINLSVPLGLTVVSCRGLFWLGGRRKNGARRIPQVREMEFIEAERALGASNNRIIFETYAA